jgi:dihydroorotate dehydrogenase
MSRGNPLINLGAGAVRLLPPEAAHRATLRLLRAGSALIPQALADDSRLRTQALGLSFPNPLGLAAGFDKDGEVPDAMLKLGFGFVECGTVTPRPQAGNPKPRLFRLTEDDAVINRMGFNNAGMSAVENNLRRRKGKGLVGINIGANKDSADRIADYVLCFEWLAPQADYVTVNVSSPNTPGLRGLQNRDELTRLLGALTEARKKSKKIPLLLKIAPDLDQVALEEIAEVALASGIEGLVVSNTTLARPLLQSLHADGLSGRPLFAPSTKILAQMRRLVGNRLVLVGVGGIAGSADAYAKIRAGASLVQLYTGLVYEGPGLVERIKQGLARRLAHDGFFSVMDAVGVDVNQPPGKS